MSIISEVDPTHADELSYHAGHEVTVRVYPDGEATIECEECGSVLIDVLREEAKPI